MLCVCTFDVHDLIKKSILSNSFSATNRIWLQRHCKSVGILPVFPTQQNGLPLGFSPKTADKLHITFPDSGLESSPANWIIFQMTTWPYALYNVNLLAHYCLRHSLCNLERINSKGNSTVHRTVNNTSSTAWDKSFQLACPQCQIQRQIRLFNHLNICL